jgi:hypothetical protein
LDELHSGAEFAVNCNATGAEVAGIRFSVHSGFNDILAFAPCLCEVIRLALSSFPPFNLSAIVYSLVDSVFEKIERTEWYLALVAASRSAQFVRFLLPFEHRLLELEDYREYVDRIGRLQLPLLTVSRSRQRLVGMTWVSCVKQNTVSHSSSL